METEVLVVGRLDGGIAYRASVPNLPQFHGVLLADTKDAATCFDTYRQIDFARKQLATHQLGVFSEICLGDSMEMLQLGVSVANKQRRMSNDMLLRCLQKRERVHSARFGQHIKICRAHFAR